MTFLDDFRGKQNCPAHLVGILSGPGACALSHQLCVTMASVTPSGESFSKCWMARNDSRWLLCWC